MALDDTSAASPIPAVPPVEAIIAGHIVRRGLVVAPLLVALFWVLRGPEGAVAAAIGVGIVVGNFWLGGWLLSSAAQVSTSLYHAAALFGFFVRLGLITGSMFAIGWMFDIDRISFGIAAVGSYGVLLLLETWAVLRGTRRELEWSS